MGNRRKKREEREGGGKGRERERENLSLLFYNFFAIFINGNPFFLFHLLLIYFVF